MWKRLRNNRQARVPRSFIEWKHLLEEHQLSCWIRLDDESGKLGLLPEADAASIVHELVTSGCPRKLAVFRDVQEHISFNVMHLSYFFGTWGEEGPPTVCITGMFDESSLSMFHSAGARLCWSYDWKDGGQVIGDMASAFDVEGLPARIVPRFVLGEPLGDLMFAAELDVRCLGYDDRRHFDVPTTIWVSSLGDFTVEPGLPFDDDRIMHYKCGLSLLSEKWRRECLGRERWEMLEELSRRMDMWWDAKSKNVLWSVVAGCCSSGMEPDTFLRALDAGVPVEDIAA